MTTDWATFIKSIPGLGKAVAELIGDIASLGSSAAKLGMAKIDQPRRAIENQTKRATATAEVATKSEVAIMKAVSDATVAYIKTNSQEIGERALQHGVHRLVKAQSNRERVVFKTIENLRLNPPTSIPDEVPSDDWLNLFGQYAENASSEQLSQHWAHILEGEIKKPGSFSFVTLLLASLLDQRLATIIDCFRPWIIEDYNIPLISPISEGALYSDLIALTGIGFITIGDHALICVDDGKDSNALHIEMQNGIIKVPITPPIPDGTKRPPPQFRVNIRVAIITPAGRELLSVLPPVSQAAELPHALMQYLNSEGFFNLKFEPRNSERK